jgi:long-chain fatty acid transport protein
MKQQRVAVGLLSGLLVCAGAYANGFRNPPEGAAALGLGGAKVALADDASAASQNPANLPELTNGEAIVSATFIDIQTSFSSPLGSADTEDTLKYLPNAFLAWPTANRDIALGLSLTTPFGQSTVWDKNSLFRYSAPYFAEMKLLNLNPAVGVKLSDKWSLGGGIDIFWSQLDMKQMFPWSALTQNMMSPDGEMHLNGEGEGLGGNLALTFRPTPRQSVALTYRSPVKVDYSGDFEVSNMPAEAQALGLTPSSDMDTSIEFPAVAALAYGIRITDTVRVEADLGWLQFSRYDTLEIDADNNNPLLHQPGDPNPMAPASLPQQWKDIWTFAVGADWTVTPGVILRAGYIFLQSPVPDETMTPTLPDGDQNVFSVGAGFHRRGHSLDVTYAYSMTEDREIQSSPNPVFNGQYETASHLVCLNYGYSF